jgi:hypothetical protein
MVPHTVDQLVPVSFSTTSIQVIVPFDRVTGHVYLNAIGATVDEAKSPFTVGAIEMTEEETENLDFIESRLVIGAAEHVGDVLFPVSVPVHGQTAVPLLSAIGSSATEAAVNIAFVNEDADDFVIVSGGIEMPVLLPKNGPLKLG